MDINWNELTNTVGAIPKSNVVREALDACTPGDPVFLSDCIIKAGSGAQPVMLELTAREERALMSRATPMLWKILVLRDEWGNVPNPGDKVIKINKVSMMRPDGSKVSSRERNIALLDGSYSERFENRVEYEVDEKGCIECSFSDAVHFLNLWGVHLRSGRTMTTKKEMSSEPCETGQYGEDGKPIMMHVHYWRYKEQTKESYEKLPLRVSADKPKRGRPRNDRA